MSWTMLRFVNQVMRELGLVGGEQTELQSFTDSSRQRMVDSIIQKTNETVHELYSATTTPIPTETRERDIVLRENIRSYQLPDSLAQIRWPLVNSKDSMRIDEYLGGYDQMRQDQLQQHMFRGTPYYACIHPNDGKLFMDRFPQAGDAGRTYRIFFDRTLTLESEDDIFPFKATSCYALVAAVAERYRGAHRGGLDSNVYWGSMARAQEYANLKIRKHVW